VTTSGHADRKVSAGGYRYYFLILCCLSFFLSYADRQLFGVLISPIQAEFHLSDTQLGALSGLAFGVCYAIFSLPLARLADLTSRKWVLTACLAAWSAATMFCGMVRSAGALVLARFAVGIGEAGGTPAAVSALSDLFPERQRGIAFAAFAASGSIGGSVVIAVGAWLATQFGWREAFLLIGLPGIALAVLMVFTAKEPVRGAADGLVDTNPSGSFWVTLAHILRRPILLSTYAGSALSSAVVSVTQWLPAFFERSHGLSLLQAGGAVGLALLVAGPVGEIVGGRMNDRLGRHGTARVFALLLVAALLTGLAGVAMALSASVAIAIACTVCWKVVATVFPAPTWALSQSLVEIRSRGVSQALLGVFQNLIGFGGGPALVGWLSEVYRPALGGDSLRWALVTAMTVLSVLASVAYWFGYRAAGKVTGASESHPQSSRFRPSYSSNHPSTGTTVQESTPGSGPPA
jgi:MFS family permease